MLVKYLFYDSFLIILRPNNKNNLITKYCEKVDYKNISTATFFMFAGTRNPNRLLVVLISQKKIKINITDERIIKKVFDILHKSPANIKLSTKKLANKLCKKKILDDYCF